ncbi:MAG: DNA/RNA nuclease SfsA, partial [Alphaproteobacteria bacterium]
SQSDNPKRKLKYSWELVQFDEDFVGVNTAHPNGIVAEAIEDGAIPSLDGYDSLKREVKYGANSRIDILLEKEDAPDCYVEVKSVTLARHVPVAEFPDSVTARGAKHLEELAKMVREGKRAVMFFLIQRTDCESFSLAADIDPAYRDGFMRALDAGVEILCYDCQISTSEITIGVPRPVNP